jgi:hypothetical protein
MMTGPIQTVPAAPLAARRAAPTGPRVSRAAFRDAFEPLGYAAPDCTIRKSGSVARFSQNMLVRARARARAYVYISEKELKASRFCDSRRKNNNFLAAQKAAQGVSAEPLFEPLRLGKGISTRTVRRRA